MMEQPFSKLAVVASCFLIIVIVCGGYYTDTEGEGFAIYLTRKDTSPTQMEALSHVDLSDRPIISVKDIITYNAQTHEVKLSPCAFTRVSELEVPVTGKPFMVCIDKEPIYWGAFWTPISSISFDGVTIWIPYSTQEKKVIALELGYPSSSFYGGIDPRSNSKVLKSLEETGKLITRLTLNTVEKLPRSMKGYELYSWNEGGMWHFTLITGTNRVKTKREITTDEDFISEIGFVNIHVVGVDEIKSVLAKLHRGESVFWCDELHIGQTTNQINLQLPPKLVVDAIREHAEVYGLVLVVAAS